MAKRIEQQRKFNKNFFQKLSSAFWDIRFGFRLLDDEKYSQFLDQGCYHTQSIEYEELNNIFCEYKFSEESVLMDIGCGRGRVFNYLLSQKYKGRMIGVEIDPEIASFTEKRLKRYNNIDILNSNVLNVKYPEVTDYFLFCPFNRELTEKFRKLIESIHNNVKVIYYYPRFVDVFLENDNWVGTKKSYWSSIRNMNIECYYLEYHKK